MSNIVTYDWTASNGTEWTADRFNQRVGSATAGPTIQSNVGHMGALAAGDRTLQSTQRITLRDHKARWLVDWANAAASGRWIGGWLRLSDDGENGYWWKLDSEDLNNPGTFNVPSLYLYRRRGGTDTLLDSIDLTGASPSVSGAQLNAGVTVWMRVQTEKSQVRVMVGVDPANASDPLDLGDYQIDYDDSSAARVESGGTWGVEIDGNAATTDVTMDAFVAMDFEDEADPVPDYAEGFSMRINGEYLDEAALIARGLQSVEVLQSYASGGGQIEARLTDINDFHRPMFQPGDEVEILFDGQHYARGLVRPTSHNVTAAGDTNAYDVYGPKMLARDVVIRDPVSNLGTLTYNLDAEHPQYDEDLADMTLGEILADVIDKHTDGEDGIRGKRAGPPDSGTAVYDSIPAEMLTGPVIPGFSVGGNIANAVETILNLMPKFAWRIDPDTRVWYFEDRTTATVEELRTSDHHMSWKFGVKANLARTVVFVRGGEPEVEWTTLSIGTGDLEEAWNTALGLESDSGSSKNRKNVDEGTVASLGVGGPSDGIYDTHLYIDTSGLGSMVDDEWYHARVTFLDGNQEGNQYTIKGSTSAGRLWFTKTTPWYAGGSPTPGDAFRITGMRGERDPEGEGDGAENIYLDMFSAYRTVAGTEMAQGKCVTASFTTPNLAGGQQKFNVAAKFTPGQNTQSGQTIIQTAVQTLLPVGLVNQLPGSRNPGWGNWKACANIGGVDADIGDLEVNIPVPQTSVPLVRVPEEGFRGGAYTVDSAKWNGAGEPGVGDAAVTTPLVVDDPSFQYQSLQEADYIAMADAMLDIWGELPRMADVKLENVWHTNFRELGRRVTILDDLDPDGNRENYGDLDSLMLVQAKWRWSPDGVSTELNCGTLNTLSGVNMDGIRRLHVDTSEQRRLKEQMKLLEEMHNCLKEQAEFAKSAISQQPAQQAACNIGYNHANAGRNGRPGANGKPGPGGGVQKKLADIEDMLEGILDDLTWKQPGQFWLNDNVDGDGGTGMIWTSPDGTNYEYNPETGDWDEVEVDPDTGETTPQGPSIGGPPQAPDFPVPFGPEPWLPGAQKGFDLVVPLENADGTSDPAHVSNNGPSPGLTAPYVDPAVTQPTGGVDRLLHTYDIPLADGGAGEVYYEYQGEFYLDGGDGIANPNGGGDDTAVAGNPLDPDNDGFPENLLGGYEGYLMANKHVMEQRLLGASSGATSIPARAGSADYEPGQTDFEGSDEFHPVYDVRDASNNGYAPSGSNTGLDNMKAGGLMGNALGDLGFTEDGKGTFGSGPGSRVEPGTSVGADGAWYYTPDTGGAVSGQPNVIKLDPADTVPASTWGLIVQIMGQMDLTVAEIDSRIGVVWTDSGGDYWVVDPSGTGILQVQAAGGGAGTGENSSDWEYVAGPVYYDAGIGGGSFLSNVVEDTSPQLGGTLDVNGAAISFPTVAVTDVKDEDDMASDSATMLATQQSIKAYVDAEVAGAGGGNSNDSILVYDNAGGIASGGALTMDTVMDNTNGSNLGLHASGHVTIADNGTYLIQADAALEDGAASTNGAWSFAIETSPSGAGTWTAVTGSDGYMGANRQVLLAGGVAQGVARAQVEVSGGGGLDVRIVTTVINASSGGGATSRANGSRIHVMRVA